MSYDVPGRLYVVTGNHVVDDVPGGMSPAPADRPVAVGRAAPRLAVLVAVAAGLTVLLALLGRQPWQLPGRDGSGVSDVPQSLLSFLVICAAACVWISGRLVGPADTLRSPGAVRLWWGLVVGAAVVSLAADLSLASFASTGQPPGDLVVRSLVPVAPAVLAGLLASDAGRVARLRAAVGTGLVTLPLGALGCALASSPAGSAAGSEDVLAITGVAVLAPLALGVALVAADRRGRPAR